MEVPDDPAAAAAAQKVDSAADLAPGIIVKHRVQEWVVAATDPGVDPVDTEVSFSKKLTHKKNIGALLIFNDFFFI